MSIDLDICNKTISVCGKRASGKSILALHLIETAHAKFKKIFLVCPTEEINAHYTKNGVIKQECVFSEWDENWAKDLTTQLTKINSNKPKAEMQHVLLVLDDVFADVDLHHSPILRSIFMRSRHYGLSVMILTQTLHSIPPFARINSDWMIFGQVNRASVQLAAEEFSTIPKDEFVELYNRSTTDHQFLVVNCNSVKDSNRNAVYGVIKAPCSD